VSEASLPGIENLSTAELRLVERRCNCFEDAWKGLHEGAPPVLEEYLAGVTEPAAGVLFCELLHLELAYRRREELLSLGGYLSRFPGRERLVREAFAGEGVEAPLPEPPPEGSRTLPDIPGHEILGELGRGGMGVVYKARHIRLNRIVALKMVLAGVHADPDQLVRFRGEAEAVARVQHPNIVQIYEVGEQDGLPFFSLEFCAGGSLAQKLGGAPLPPEQAAMLVEVVAKAVHAAHQAGVVHRDLKPANVLLARSDRAEAVRLGGDSEDTGPFEPKITDFGVAKQLDAAGLTASWAVIGTPSYMALEQAGGNSKEVGPATDVYALGAILYECLTGRPPFRGATRFETLEQVRNQEPVPPRQLQPRCPRDLETICLKCLRKEPGRRYPSAEALAEDLANWRAGRPINARPVGWFEKLWRWCYRHPVPATVAAVILATLVTALAAERGRLAAQLAYEAEKRQSALDRALMAAMSGDLDAADQAIAEAERAGASPGQVQMLRGQIALHRGQSREAREYLEKAVGPLPNSVAAWGMLAAAHADDGHWERYDKAIQKMEQLTPSTPEDFLFKGYAQANLEPSRGLQTIKQAFDHRPMMGIALLIRAEVRALVAQDMDDIKEAEGAVQDAKYAKELLPNNPAALWVSLEAHLAKAGVHEHHDEPKQRGAELELAGEEADLLKPFTELPKLLPEAVVYRWLYFREVGREEEVLDELRQASKETEHVYVNFCCALTLYRRGQRADFEEALRVLEKRPGRYNERLRPFVLAEYDYPDKHDWQARARKACEVFAKSAQDGAAVMDTQSVLCLLGDKGKRVEASKELLLERPGRFYTLRHDPIWRCLQYNAGELTEDQLIRRAGRSRWDQCLAHYNVAMTKLAEGDRKGAHEHFDKVVKTRAFFWGAYDLSWVFRARLEKGPAWPRWIP
jgi:tetratricopeptide (TPR) repeat protein